MSGEDLHAIAKSLPSQGGSEIGPWLEKYAAEVPQGAAIVELGCWLGAGTAFLALGAQKSGAEIHVWDRFFCSGEEERGKAAAFGLDLAVKQDTLPIVKKSLGVFDATIHFYKGSFKPGVPTADWPSQQPIGLYVDDLTKTEPIWSHAMAVFLPYLIPGALLVLMDFYFYEAMRDEGYQNWRNYLAQKNFIESRPGSFEMVDERMGGTSTAVFRFLG